MPVAYNQSGYVGSSMSERAMEAYENGEAPKSKWSKTAMLATIEDYCYDNDYLINADGSVDMTPFEKMTKTDLFDKFFRYTSWHHTSKYANETDFYGLDEDLLERAITTRLRVSNSANGLVPFAGLDENGTLYFYADKKKPKTTHYQGKNFERIFTVDLNGFDLLGSVHWEVVYSIKRIHITKSFNKIPLKSLCSWFDCFGGCEEIDGLENLDTSQVTDMSGMFKNCYSLTNIDGLANCDMSSVTDMGSMFHSCKNLTNLDALAGLNTGSVTNMSYIFYNCENLTNLDALANWDTSNVKTLEATFSGCSSLKNVDGLVDWNIGNAISLLATFYDCDSLANIDGLANWDTSNTKSIKAIFDKCMALTNVDALANWDTSNVVNMGSIFKECEQLKSISGLANWDTSNVTTLYNAFYLCSHLTSVDDLVGWNTSSVTTSMGEIFCCCSSLKNVDVLDANWDTSNVDPWWCCF